MKKAFLMILDGWGHGSVPEASAIHRAQTPYMDNLYKTYPNSELITYGGEVGLPGGQMGNSEVGHLNIGAGRVVYQELARINKSIADRSLHQDPIVQESIDYARSNGKNIHIMGLLSDGGVHSHIDHLLALCDIYNDKFDGQVYIHAFTDGRDTDPHGGIDYIDRLNAHIEQKNARLASVIGRYYAMDRDKRWERIKQAYDLLVNETGEAVEDWHTAIKKIYTDGKTDEFLPPMYHKDHMATVKEGDVVVFFNFRTDRPRELVEVLSQKDHPDHNMSKMDLHFVCFARYDETFKNIHVVFEKEDIQDTLGETISSQGGRQIRIAETEKYPHVTYFFNGGREQPFEGEDRILIPSPSVATYDLKPEMSAIEIKDAIIEAIKEKEPDFICLNFANPDMVGHTGSMEAAVKAVECIDTCMSELVETAKKHDYQMVIIADHGNADYMINDDGSPNTAHTTNPVPCILITNDPTIKGVQEGKLGDIAPTILQLMGLEKPEAMTGKSLLIR